MEHDEVITTEHRLREVLGYPGEYAAAKSIDHIDGIFVRFIAASPYVLISTIGKDGLPDISPKGDPAGFVKVLDAETLVIPDRPGNRRHDSFINLLANPGISLLFIVPGNTETLRVAGKAQIVNDRALCNQMAINGKVPAVCIVISVEEAFMHCGKASVRSKLWRSEFWPDRSDVPTIAESLKKHANARESIQELQKREDEVTISRLY
jgi:PPOX class probable FMN-dependent enzyme